MSLEPKSEIVNAVEHDLYDESDYSYDDAEELARDPEGFKNSVYGHYDGDQSQDVPRSEPTPDMVKMAETDDLEGIISMVEAAAQISHDNKLGVMNCAAKKVTTEVWREELKVFQCFGATPLIAAASKGHHDIVEYLLRNGADPTLKGCVGEHKHIHAIDAANQVLGNTFNGRGSKKELMQKCCKPRRCVDMLTLTKYFWEDTSDSQGSYSSCGYHEAKRLSFNNAPTNMSGFIDALGTVHDISEYPENALDHFVLKEKYCTKPKMTCSSCGSVKYTSYFARKQVEMGTTAKCMSCVCKEKRNKIQKG